jgi:hypothetical protein
VASSKVIWWPYPTPLPVPVWRVLESAAECQAVLILGLDADGASYMAASLSDKATLLYWIEQFRHKLLAGDLDG